MEGINAIVTDKLIALSEQELVDCDVAHDNGCNGGLMDFAFEFIKKNGGIDTEKDYKYQAEQESCSISKERRHVVSIDGYEDVPGNDEQSLLKVPAFIFVSSPQAMSTFPQAVQGQSGLALCAKTELSHPTTHTQHIKGCKLCIVMCSQVLLLRPVCSVWLPWM